MNAVLIGVGVYIRTRLEESPEHAEAQRTSTVRKTPLVDAFRFSWRSMLPVVVVLCVLGTGINFAVVSVYSLSYGTGALGLPRSTMLLGFLVLLLMLSANLAAMPTFFAPAFPTSLRYGGMGVSYNLGAVIGGSPAPLISALLLRHRNLAVGGRLHRRRAPAHPTWSRPVSIARNGSGIRMTP